MRTMKMMMFVFHFWGAFVFLAAGHEFSGRKLIHAGWADGNPASIRKNIRLMEDAAPGYSGMRIFITGTDEEGKTVTHRMMFGSRKFRKEYFRSAVRDLKATDFRRFTDNFIATGVQPGKISWFSDQDWEAVCGNFALFAEIARETGMKGLIFDSEEYTEKLWRFKNVPGKKREECIAMARERGRRFGKAIFGTYPECRLFCFFWLSLDFRYASSPEDAQLSAHFIDGVYDVLPPGAMIYDGMENLGYRLRSRNDLNRAAKLFYQDFPRMLSPENRAKYYAQTRMAGALYLDAYFSLPETKSYAYWLADGKKKYGTADFFRRNLQLTLEMSDEYAWTWGEGGAWWILPGSRRISWEKHCPGARQALLDALHPVAAAERVVRERKRPNLLQNPQFGRLSGKGIPENWKLDQNKKISRGHFEFMDGKVIFRNVIDGSIYQTLPVIPGKEYFLTVEGEIPFSEDSPGAQLLLSVNFRNSRGELTGFNAQRYRPLHPTGKDGKYKASLLFDTPDDAVKLIVFLQALNLEKNGTASLSAPALYER